MWLKDRSQRNASPDITPLVDLVFLLIIFFLLSTTFRVSPGIRIDLPVASSQKVTHDKEEITLSVDKAGTVYLNKTPVDSHVLPHRLAAAAREAPDIMLLIRGDGEVAFSKIVDLLGTVKDCGLHRIAIMTKRKKDGANDSVKAGEK